MKQLNSLIYTKNNIRESDIIRSVMEDPKRILSTDCITHTNLLLQKLAPSPGKADQIAYLEPENVSLNSELKIPEKYKGIHKLPEKRYIYGLDKDHDKAIAEVKLSMASEHNKSMAAMLDKCWVINCNISNLSTHKMLDLVTTFANNHIFAINECFYPVEGLKDGSAIPKGYRAVWNTPDNEGLVYCIILYKEELQNDIFQIPMQGTFVAIAINKNDEKGGYALVNTYRPCSDSTRYVKGFGEGNDIWLRWCKSNLKKIDEIQNTPRKILVGDFNCMLVQPRTSAETVLAGKILELVRGYKDCIRGMSHYRPGNKPSKIDYIFTKGFSALSSKNLNLIDDLSTNGHVGQELCIDLDMSYKKRQYVTYSRPILEP